MTLYLGKQQVAMTMNHIDESAVAQKVDKVTTPNIVYGTDSNGDQTTYDKNSFGQVDDVKVNGTSVVDNKVASITLGTMASENTTSYYTKTELDGKLNSAMHFKGTKDRVADLPSSGQEVGDMWNVQSTGANYAWDGSAWDKLSENIDLSGLQPNLTSSNAGTGISITGSGSNVVISNTQTSAEWGNITGTLSNQTDLNNALNDKANDSDVVKLSGSQSISGVKTFNTAYTLFKGTAIDITNAKTTQSDVGINWLDKNGTVLGQNIIRTYTTGSVQNNMYIKAHNSNNWACISVGFDANDNAYTYAPTPATSDNSTMIATTAFVVNVLNTIYPVGSLFFSTSSTCPLQALGIGTWTNVGTSLTLSVNTNVPVKGNGMTLGVTKDGTTTNTLVGHYGSWSGVGGTNLFVDNYNSVIGSGQSHTNVPGAIGITTDSSKSGIVGTITRTQITVNVFQRTA